MIPGLRSLRSLTPGLPSTAAPRLVESRNSGRLLGQTFFPAKTFSLLTAHCSLLTAHCSLLRRVITFTRAHLRIFHAANLNANFSKLAIARLVRRIVAEAVLRADLVCDLRKCRARVPQRCRRKISAARSARKLVHLNAREIVEPAADVHPLKLTQPAEILIVFFLRAWHEKAAKAFQLL